MPAYIATQTEWWRGVRRCPRYLANAGSGPDALAETPGWGLRYVGFAAAAIAFLVAASIVPTVLRNWLQQQQEQSSILRLTATNSRMKSLLLEVNPVPARVRAARCNCRREPAWG